MTVEPGVSITAAARRLKPEELRAVCEPAALGFASTEGLAPLEGMIGQARALEATTFGIRMKHRGYNLFALGLPATITMRRLLDAAAAGEPAGRLIAEGTLLVDTDGAAVGRVNGISVLVTGDHAFGRPARITARTYSGPPGAVYAAVERTLARNVERLRQLRVEPTAAAGKECGA